MQFDLEVVLPVLQYHQQGVHVSLYSYYAATQNRTRTIKLRTYELSSTKERHLTEFHEKAIRELSTQIEKYKFGHSRRMCPSCNKFYARITLDQILLDYCRRCHGIWFDAGELIHFTDLLTEIPGESLAHRVSRFECPICEKQMLELQFSSDANILVDGCPDGHGVMLEAGEFERILAAVDDPITD